MKLEKIELENFRGISKTSISFSEKLNVIVGANGSGKSSILDAVVISLSWLVNRIQRETASGKPITEPNIKNDASFASIATEISNEGSTYNWKIVRTQKGYPSQKKSDLTSVTELAAYYQDTFRNKNILPVIAYYPINRAVNALLSDVSGKDSTNTLDVYDNALGGKANYQSFFEWFRLQDDIVNERANSRTKWMAVNKSWVKARVDKMLLSLNKIVRGDDEIRFKKQLLDRFKQDRFIYEEPRYLFIELSEVLNFARYSGREENKYGEIFHELGYMLHKMSSLSDSDRDNLIELNNYPFRMIQQISNQIYHSIYGKESGTNDIKIRGFIWEALSLAVILSLWWVSDKGKKEIEHLFKEFSPVRYRIAGRKVLDTTDDLLSGLKKVVTDDLKRYDKATKSQGRELHYVTKTIEDFIPGYSNLRISRIPRPQMLVEKNGETINLDQLSDGEKNLIALVGDIARRLSIANSNSSNPLNGEGIILIDEVDLHLHPAWQRLMLPQLTKLFPNCQFIITTHSPQVISHAKPESIFLIKMKKREFSYSKATESYGKNTDRILEDLLDVDARPTKEKKMIHSLYTLIQDGNLDEAKEKIRELLDLIGEDPELSKAMSLLTRKEIIGK